MYCLTQYDLKELEIYGLQADKKPSYGTWKEMETVDIQSLILILSNTNFLLIGCPRYSVDACTGFSKAITLVALLLLSFVISIKDFFSAWRLGWV